MKKIFALTLSLIASSTAMAAEDQVKMMPVLQPSFANELATLAQKNCAKDGVHVSVSVVDAGGDLLIFKRGKGSGPHTVTTSFRKAYTAGSIKMATAALAGAKALPKFWQLGKMTDDILLLQGGLPIFYKGVPVGGIGMSGAPAPEVEEKCAIDALAELLPK